MEKISSNWKIACIQSSTIFPLAKVKLEFLISEKISSKWIIKTKFHEFLTILLHFIF